MKCKLCLENGVPAKKSHIIPDFMYRDLFDNKHRIFEANVKDGELKTKIAQTGSYESNLLCEKCENERLGKLERYASMLLYGGTPTIIRNEINVHGMKSSHCKEINYPYFRLFLLSIIWRASISKLQIFSNVNLGPHEDVIREMILNKDPGNYKKYPCIMITYINQKKLPHQLIGEPILSRKGGTYTYFFLIGGVLYIYFISQHNIPDWVFECVLNSDGEMRIVHMLPKMASKTINGFIGMDIF